MSDIAIKAENVGKLYRLGQIGTGTISHDLNRWWASLRGKEDPFAKIGETNDRSQKGESDYVWALKEVDFEIKKGEAVGIIGRNGAGKSTLLKLLSKVTKPSTGQIKVNGRIASLLEVGTGFHPEMTGRENIYLNGAILGMTKKEITRKFDEIVDFSGVERYVDTPVKRYSSGMYVRLAFAVAAHLESEILIVDEVLAVGDAEFQKKCLGKMNDVSKGEGRTVLFVSHNMGAIQTLCTNTLILKNGALLLQGKTEMVIREYFTQNSSNIRKVVCEQSNKKIWFKTIFVTNKAGLSKTEFLHDDPIYIKYQLGYNIEKTTHDYTIFCIILDQNKKRIFSAESGIVKNDEYALIINPNTLVRGAYSIHTFIHKPRTEQIDVAEDVCEFQVIDNGSWLNIHGEYDYGVVFGNSTWVDIQYIAK
ncbi:MAG TPA: polysaccharide ABC transporter ATP-binding protein [Niabella sp.]|nr:polysaccharide ABC transporter ATP-binding protein [Niabella sp.]HOZ97351.1 polysaccharide ABC transporter ATP-binding protein [Niabella sp.]HQW15378.1 polysaccharide ABC transporter ATP-binding protein [Niabella sp.]HQX20576.1 polysaccharide ABC transporter ATP-binding protein [Niabella sp.]HQX40961.1 polysaccharide ABC transporter ATP-binding protein [Niabella sp.]